ncbi:FAD-dependent oxidoreductase [Adlercreutzia sp. R7]|uniref:FAD-dependent oxidoreductase n=1 Tax=Adlercreutzia wanghongyangiae TaxID=3111451 RepID=A0ABU6IKI9_9ACTN|nr:FAD-dependent oxidoreductase [Adlercreutzia sp. R7]
MNLSRRNFLKGAAFGTAGLGAASAAFLTGCAPQTPTEADLAETGASTSSDYPVQVLGAMDEAAETFEGDVVVLGCGPGGIACATRLAEEGARVLVVEKTTTVGGTGLVCSGNCYISLNSQYQQDQGLEADIPAFYKEWLEAVHYHCDHEVLSTYLRNCGRVVDWLLGYGFGFHMKETPATNGLTGFAYRISQPAKDSGNRQEVYGKMMDLVAQAGGAFHGECTGTELIVDDEGTVVGLRADRNGETVDFMAKAVVIASGGYGANREMIDQYAKNPLLGRDPVLNNGEGARMAWAAGAKQPWNLGALCVDTLYPIDADHVSYPGGVQALGNVMQDAGKARMHVNQLGRRFHSEDAFCWVPTYGGTNAVACDEPYLFVIADQAALDALKDSDETVDDAYLESMTALGVLFAGDTPEALAEAVGWDPAVFSEEFSHYNELCAQGEDPVFFKTAQHLVPYGAGPYYAVRMAPTPFGTCGDLNVTPRMEVRGVEPGSTVKGLYAVGTETVGTMHNDYYWALGQTVGWAHTSGVLAAEEIAANVLS